MTWNEVVRFIATMSPEQRKKGAVARDRMGICGEDTLLILDVCTKTISPCLCVVGEYRMNEFSEYKIKEDE